MSRFVLSPVFAQGQSDWSLDLNPFGALPPPDVADPNQLAAAAAPASTAAALGPATAAAAAGTDDAVAGGAAGGDPGATPESGGFTLPREAASSLDIIAADLTGNIETEEPWAAALASATAASGTIATSTTAAATTPAKLLTSYTSGAAGGYNITIQFQGTWTAPLQQVFVGAADRISKMIVGDVPNVTVSGIGAVDDIVISAKLAAIDGVGGILGSAGPTALRTGSYLPAAAQMQFDSADATAYNNMGLFDEIVTHEMLHSVGIGTIWGLKGLTSGSNYVGKNAVGAFNTLVDAYKASHKGGLTLSDGVVLKPGTIPLETTGGSGTAGSHWSEAVFDSELMTGYIDTANHGANASAAIPDPLSQMTVAALKDLGYATSATPPADAYKLL